MGRLIPTASYSAIIPKSFVMGAHTVEKPKDRPSYLKMKREILVKISSVSYQCYHRSLPICALNNHNLENTLKLFLAFQKCLYL